MNNLCTDIGYHSLNHVGEQLCGDQVVVVKPDEDTEIVVLADGLGSGVKACILSTLTSKIISTMMAESMPIEECVSTIASTLPVCKVRGVAYSTFTILKIYGNEEAEIIQYDNPHVILLRDGKNFVYPETSMEIGGKTIYKSKIKLTENDVFIMMSDGCIHAGVGMALNYGWQRDNIIDYMEKFYTPDATAKGLTTILLDECNKLYGGNPGDDTTVCSVKIRQRQSVNLMIGPPADPKDVNKMMSLFFSKQGKHIVCGGTTSSLAAQYLGKEVRPTLDYLDPEIPPTAEIDGVDLVTEGVITINRVVVYAQSYVKDNEKFNDWNYGLDGASAISRMLFEEATDINFFVGRASNAAHQNPDLPIGFNIKMQLVEQLAEALKTMGKKIKVSYF
ncbi:MAG: serine/threonine-protein phosphatase [Firmicutes bacterium]|nr:serine/threonine-protein phosphatase [[Eubacterium] siraeum]MCM1488016.1 serine/threonine-protein phosphatase [Bacillota bacterium]